MVIDLSSTAVLNTPENIEFHVQKVLKGWKSQVQWFAESGKAGVRRWLRYDIRSGNMSLNSEQVR